MSTSEIRYFHFYQMVFSIGILISLRSKWRLTVSLRRFAPSDTVRLHTYPVPDETTFPIGEGLTLLTPKTKNQFPLSPSRIATEVLGT